MSESAPILAAKVTEDDLKGLLPSKIAYSKLNNPNGLCKGDANNLPEGIENKLSEHGDTDGGYTNEIKTRWCYVTQPKESNLCKSERCGLLYYWFGDIISTGFQGTDFTSIMNIVRQKLQNLDPLKQCEIVRSPFGIDQFPFEKKVYDHYIDHNTIETKVGNGESGCSDALKGYLDEAKNAYDLLGAYCETHTESKGNDPYCTKFRTIYKQHNPKNLLSRKCGITEEQESIAKITHRPSAFFIEPKKGNPVPASISSGGSTASSIIPSILGLIGLPTIFFLLYKVIDNIVED